MGFFAKVLSMIGLGPKAAKRSDPTSPATLSPGEDKSLLKMLVKMGAEIGAKPCSVDHNTSAMCAGTIMMYGTKMGAAGVTIDVGGYCPRCNVHRCAKHSAWLRMDLAGYRKAGGHVPPEIETFMSAYAHTQGKVFDSIWILGCPTCKQNYAGEKGIPNFHVFFNPD